jgi:hypothetical protein
MVKNYTIYPKTANSNTQNMNSQQTVWLPCEEYYTTYDNILVHPWAKFLDKGTISRTFFKNVCKITHQEQNSK